MRDKKLLRLLSVIIVFIFLIQNSASFSYAQLLSLPPIGTLVEPTAPVTPLLIKGIKLHPENPFQLDFLIDTGTSLSLEDNSLKEESYKEIKYFLAALTTPENDMWVNLSPYEDNRIAPVFFGQTVMGRDLLAQDYILKQLTASLMHPQKDLGQDFWDEVYKTAYNQYGETQISTETFNKVWIVPDKAVVYENKDVAYVVESRLKVMLEEDYLASEQHMKNKTDFQAHKSINTDLIRKIIIPAIEKEVNEGSNFASLRQIYNSLILAAWFKRNLKQNVLNQIYTDKNKIGGINVSNSNIDIIYDKYLEAFKKGVYDVIKEEYDPSSQQIIPRKYFSGGVSAYKVGQVLAVTQNKNRLKNSLRRATTLFLLTVTLMTSTIGCQSFSKNSALKENKPIVVQVDKKLFNGQTNREFINNYLLSVDKNQELESILGKFNHLSKEELLSILNWTEDSRHQSLFNYMYKWWSENVDSMIKQDDFEKIIHELSINEIFSLIKAVLSKGDRTYFIQDLVQKGDVIQSAEFKRKYADLDAMLQISSLKNSHYQVFTIMMQGKGIEGVEIFRALKSQEYKEYRQQMIEAYGIDVVNDLIRNGMAYLNPIFRNEYNPSQHPEKIVLFRKIKKIFPDLEIKNLFDLTIMGEIKDSNLEGLKEKYERFVKIYNIRITKSGEILTFYKDLKTIDLLLMQTNIDLWIYLNKSYPNLMKDFNHVNKILTFEGFYQRICEPIQKTQMPFEMVDKFLSFFGTNIIEYKYLNQLREISPSKMWEILGRENDFKKYMDTIFKKFSKTQEFFRESIHLSPIDFVNGFTQQDKIFELNTAIQDFWGETLPVIFFHQDSERIVTLLRALNENEIKFSDDLKWDVNNGYRFLDLFAVDYQKLLDKIHDGTAKNLFQTMKQKWGIDEVKFNDLIYILCNQEYLSMFLDSEKAKKFMHLKEIYNLGVKKDGSTDIKILSHEFTSDSYTWIIDLMKADFLFNSDVKHIVDSLLTKLQYDNGETGIEIFELSNWASSHADFFQNPNSIEIVNNLTTLYQVPLNSIGVFLHQDFKDQSEFLKQIKDPSTKQVFDQMLAILQPLIESKNLSLLKINLVYRAIALKNDPQLISLMQSVVDLGQDLTSASIFDNFEKFILKDESIRSNLLNPEFKNFYKLINKTFYEEKASVSFIAEISGLFDAVNKNGSVSKDLFKNMDRVLTLLRTRFGIAVLEPSTLEPILSIAQNFNLAQMQSLIDYLEIKGDKVSGNDFILIFQILNTPSYETPLRENYEAFRNTLIARVQEYYQKRKESPRRHMDKIGNQMMKLKNNQLTVEEKQKLQQEVAQYQSNYTERPNPEQLPILQLIRLDMLISGLENTVLQQKMGHLILKDVGDTTTELGGVFTFKNGKLNIISDQSHSEFNGAYSTQKYGFFSRGIATFHMHALTLNEPDYSGPSGWLEAYGGDIPFVDGFDATDVVITPLGHPKDASGKELTDRVLVNLDMYFIDKTDKQHKKLNIIDLGVHDFPLQNLSKEAIKAADSKLTDKGQLTDPVGGIDFNPIRLQILATGEGMTAIQFPLEINEMLAMPIDGLVPLIQEITPVTNANEFLNLAN